MSCGAASRCWRLSGPRKVWTQDAAGQGRALVVLNGVAGLARRPAISPSKRRTVRRAGEGLREAVLREMPDPLERIDVLEIWVRHRQITAEQRAVGGAGVTIRHRAVELCRGAGAPLAGRPTR
jgi:hypothetical protein